MQYRRFAHISMISAIAAAIVGFSGAPALGTSSTCVDNGTVEVCAEWSLVADPVEGTHFRVTFDGASPADVELISGNLEWRLWTTLVSSGAVTDFGDITLDPDGTTDDYNVRIYGDGEAGAVNVNSVNLDGTIELPSWVGYSSMEGLSFISGDLGGLTLLETSAGVGGVLNGLLVSGDLTGAMTVPTVTGALNEIASDVTENADISIQQIDDGTFTINGDLVCDGETCPDITIIVEIDNGVLDVEGGVPAGSTITIRELTAGGEAEFSQTEVFAGTLVLITGVQNSGTKVTMLNLFSGVIDLTGDDVAGELAVYTGTATAEIKNGDEVSGDVYLGIDVEPDNDYAGTATFASVSSTGEIGTQETGFGDCDISGTITVTGNMDGEIIISGRLLAAGKINVSGICNGPIDIGQETVSGSEISLRHLDDDGIIEINTGRGDLDAAGAIKIGKYGFGEAPGPPPVTFDGCIRIYDDGSGNGGALDGSITVIGCHSTSDDLNICIDGADNGHVLIQQATCIQQVDWSCDTCP